MGGKEEREGEEVGSLVVLEERGVVDTCSAAGGTFVVISSSWVLLVSGISCFSFCCGSSEFIILSFSELWEEEEDTKEFFEEFLGMILGPALVGVGMVDDGPFRSSSRDMFSSGFVERDEDCEDCEEDGRGEVPAGVALRPGVPGVVLGGGVVGVGGVAG